MTPAAWQHTPHWRRWLIGLPMLVLPLLLGGARPWLWSCVAALFNTGLAAALLAGAEFVHTRHFTRKLGWGLGLLLAYPFLQTLPLPVPLLALFSPQRAAWISKATLATGLPVWFGSISYDPLTTVFAGCWWVFLAGFALLLRQTLLEALNHDWFFRLLFLLAGFEACYGLLQALIPSLGVLGQNDGTGHARGTFINRNHYAAFLGMLWPVLLARTLSLSSMARWNRARSIAGRDRPQPSTAGRRAILDEALLHQVRQKQWFLGFVTAMVLLALFFSQSRGGISGALLAVTVMTSFPSFRSNRGLAVVAGCWLIMFIYGGVIGFEEILARFDRLAGDTAGRFVIWKDAWALLRENLLAGSGLGSYGRVLPIHQTHLADNLHVGHAHNDYLELAVELGLPLALGVCFLVWGYWWKTACRTWQHDWQCSSRGQPDSGSGTGQRMIRVGALAGAAAFLCHSWVEFNWQIPANQLYFIVLLVLIKPCAAKGTRQRPTSRHPPWEMRAIACRAADSGTIAAGQRAIRLWRDQAPTAG